MFGKTFVASFAFAYPLRGAKAKAKGAEKTPMFGKPRPEGSGSPSQQIEVIDIKNNITPKYDSISAAALALNIKPSRISMYFRRRTLKINPTKILAIYFQKVINIQ